MVLAHPAGGKGNQRQPEQQVQVGPEHAAGDVFARHGAVMMVVPVDADVDEAEHVAEEHRQQRRSASRLAPCGTFSSSTMMVMMMAITPSLNASILL